MHTSPIFDELKILKFEDIYLFNLGKFIYQYKHKLLPDCFECPLLTVNQIQNYNTRKSRTLSVPYCRTNTRLLSVNYQGSKFFNTLNPDIYVIHHLFLVFNLSFNLAGINEVAQSIQA